jgi:4-hydroxybutyrate CoA-transferase
MTTAAETAADAVAFVPARSHVVVGSGAAEPVALLTALQERRNELTEVILSGGLLQSAPGLLRDGGPFRLRTWFPPRKVVDNGPCSGLDYLPLTWHQIPGYLRRARPDVALIQVSPLTTGGWHSFGISTSHARAMVTAASVVIAEANAEMPVTCGDSMIHSSEIDVLVSVEHDLAAFPRPPCDEAGRAVADRVVGLIPDNCTLQVGIGAIPDEVLRVLATAGRRDITLLSQLGDAGRQLIESGACVADRPQAVVGEVAGSTELYRWVHRNPAVEMADVDKTHAVRVGDGHRRLVVAVNSAFEIDLLGQVNTEILAGQQVGLIGGGLDFAFASSLSEADLYVVALKSATSDGRSRIVPMLEGVTSVPRALAHWVVTECGAVDLRDKSVGERARVLASIADPRHRDRLAFVARSLGG